MFRQLAFRASRQRRYMGGGHHHSGESFHGFHAPHVADWHRNAGETMMTLTFLWIFYRAKEDWTFVLGLQYPWDAHGHHHDDAHHHDDNGANEWVREKLGKAPVLSKNEEH